jgi:hypothetical protein
MHRSGLTDDADAEEVHDHVDVDEARGVGHGED